MYATNKKKIFDDIVNKQCNDGQSHRPNVLCQKKCRIKTTFQIASMKY